MGATESGVFALAREAGIELESGTALPWLSNRGHLNPELAGAVPETTSGPPEHDPPGARWRRDSDGRQARRIEPAAGLLAAISRPHRRGRRDSALHERPAGDCRALPAERRARLRRRRVPCADRPVERGRRRLPRCQAVDFPRTGGRRAQRAYFDAVRDPAAPFFGWRVLRVPAPGCDAAIAVARLKERIASPRLAPAQR